MQYLPQARWAIAIMALLFIVLGIFYGMYLLVADRSQEKRIPRGFKTAFWTLVWFAVITIAPLVFKGMW